MVLSSFAKLRTICGAAGAEFESRLRTKAMATKRSVMLRARSNMEDMGSADLGERLKTNPTRIEAEEG